MKRQKKGYGQKERKVKAKKSRWWRRRMSGKIDKR